MLSIENITKHFGPQLLFEKASFAVSEQARIGCIGPNGAGKTTFFRMLVGEEHPDQGEIRYPKKYQVALLRQEWIPESEDTVLEAALRENRPWHTARQKMRALEKSMAKDHDPEDVEAYHESQVKFESLGGFSVEARAREILGGLGFPDEELTKRASTLSGGWRMRCHLAGLLLQEADLLLLDEPTNHLDIETVVWLENFLLSYPKAFMVISHDHRLIDRLSSEILEFAPPTLTLWPGNLKQYERDKAQRMEQIEAEVANMEKEIARMRDFVRRFRAKATKARQAQNRLKTSEAYEEKLEELKAKMPIIARRPSRFKLDLTRRLPRMLLEIENASFGYSKDNPLFELDKCVIEAGKKIGVIGVNGVGKTTFLRTCAGEIPHLDGHLQRSEVAEIGYFAQHRMEELPLDVQPLDYLCQLESVRSPQEARNIAAALGLGSNDLDKTIRVLSGGEKARVSLSHILLKKPGLLLLDEPTNHLDMEACTALQRGLKDYEGTVLVVSHNRDFLDAFVEFILEIRPGEAILHHGNYSEWRRRQSGEDRKEAKSTPQKKGNTGKKTKEQKRREAEERKNKFQSQKKVRKEFQELEERLSRKRKEKEETEAFLCNPASPQKPEFPEAVKRQQLLDSEIDMLEERWLEMSEELEEAS